MKTTKYAFPGTKLTPCTVFEINKENCNLYSCLVMMADFERNNSEFYGDLLTDLLTQANTLRLNPVLNKPLGVLNMF